jgi:hypothetical protein
MAKRLCCGFRGKIYYTDVNEKEGIMVGQRVEVTDSAVEAVMEKLCYMAESKKPFDGKAEIEINGFKLSIDGTGNPRFMEKYGGNKNERTDYFTVADILGRKNRHDTRDLLHSRFFCNYIRRVCCISSHDSL